MHRRVLLKVLHKHLANDEDVRARFIREARACAALRSEHIVQIYDLTGIDGAPAIVMEFVEGQSLKEVIANRRNNSFDFTKKTALHVLRGLAIAHDKGIIHRDIKPGNILVSNDGTLKVTDFGLASFALSPTVTMEGMVLGTPAYMAPEQIRGDEVDTRTDLFALGTTLVEVMSGERMFEGSTYTECMKKVLAFNEPELEKYTSHATPEFVQILKKLMHPKKEERFASAQDALSALGEKKSSIFLRPDAVTMSRQRTFVPIAVGAIVIALFIIFGWMELSEPSVMQETQQPENEMVGTDTNSIVQQLQNANTEAVKPVNENVPLVKELNSASPSTKSAAKDSAKIFFASTPWAKVYINNQLIGETPIAKPILLAAGSHTVMFTNPAFDPIVRSITVEPNKELTVTGNFLEHVGYLMCTIVPWAEVYIDEQYKDTTPLSKPIMLSAGKHSVRLKNASFADIVKEITVVQQDTLQLSLSFTR